MSKMDAYYVPFTKEMAKDYTILIPTMLPMHFRMIAAILRTYGYKIELLETSGPEIAETGLKYVHNDTCYPAILVIGQLMQALQSGKYDPHKVAMVQFQTGGGCRASNYISLLRKALQKAGYGYVPVISFSVAGIEKHPGFPITVKRLHAMLYGVLYGDLLMTLVNQCRTYEVEQGAAQTLADDWTARLGREMGQGGRIRYRRVLENYRAIVRDFAKLPLRKYDAVKVGVVGEIFVKYSPLGNNNLEAFLVGEGAEVVVPGLIDFCLYCVYNNILDHEILWGGRDFPCGMKKNGALRPLEACEPVPDKKLRVAVSRFHVIEWELRYIDHLRSLDYDVELVPLGASSKQCMVAQGLIDICPKFAKCSEWDSAAGHAIVEAAGGLVVNVETNGGLRYNKAEMLNPPFILFNRRIHERIKAGETAFLQFGKGNR